MNAVALPAPDPRNPRTVDLQQVVPRRHQAHRVFQVPWSMIHVISGVVASALGRSIRTTSNRSTNVFETINHGIQTMATNAALAARGPAGAMIDFLLLVITDALADTSSVIDAGLSKWGAPGLVAAALIIAAGIVGDVLIRIFQAHRRGEPIANPFHDYARVVVRTVVWFWAGVAGVNLWCYSYVAYTATDVAGFVAVIAAASIVAGNATGIVLQPVRHVVRPALVAVALFAVWPTAPPGTYLVLHNQLTRGDLVPSGLPQGHALLSSGSRSSVSMRPPPVFKVVDHNVPIKDAYAAERCEYFEAHLRTQVGGKSIYGIFNGDRDNNCFGYREVSAHVPGVTPGTPMDPPAGIEAPISIFTGQPLKALFTVAVAAFAAYSINFAA